MRPRRVADQGSAPFSRASRAGDPGGDPLGILGGSDPFFGDPGFLRGQLYLTVCTGPQLAPYRFPTGSRLVPYWLPTDSLLFPDGFPTGLGRN